MEKWADFLISAVQYDEDGSRIDKVRVHEDRGEKVGPVFEETRPRVAGKIDDGHSYATVYRGSNSNWKRGEDIHTVEVDGEKFIRTDKNAKTSDNLGELPGF